MPNKDYESNEKTQPRNEASNDKDVVEESLLRSNDPDYKNSAPITIDGREFEEILLSRIEFMDESGIDYDDDYNPIFGTPEQECLMEEYNYQNYYHPGGYIVRCQKPEVTKKSLVITLWLKENTLDTAFPSEAEEPESEDDLDAKIQKKLEFMDDNEISYDSSFNPINTTDEEDELMEEFDKRIGLD